MLSEPSVLEDFYDFVFEKKTGEKPEKNHVMRKTDAKFNTMSLLKSKTEFNKKIFNLKANY